MSTDAPVIYYSDFGLERQDALPRGRMGPINHVSRLKALLLTTDHIHIPLSHLLSLRPSTFDAVFSSEIEFYREGMIGFMLSIDTPDISSYVEKFSTRPKVDQHDLLFKREALLNGGVVPGSERYSGEDQSSLFREIVGRRIDDLALTESVERGYTIVRSLIDSSGGKEDFDSAIQRELGGSQIAGELKRLSDATYYVVGAKTSGAVVSGNSFLTLNLLRRLGIFDWDSDPPLIGDLVNPSVFQTFLLFAGAIGYPLDLAYVASPEIKEIKRDSGYQDFLSEYYAFFGNLRGLLDIIRRYERERAVSNACSSAMIASIAFVAASSFAPVWYEELLNWLCGPISMLVDSTVRAINFAGTLDFILEQARRVTVRPDCASVFWVDNLLNRLDGTLRPMTHASELIREIVKRHRP